MGGPADLVSPSEPHWHLSAGRPDFWTDGERARIINLYLSGATAASISKTSVRTLGAIQQMLCKTGVRKPRRPTVPLGELLRAGGTEKVKSYLRWYDRTGGAGEHWGRRGRPSAGSWWCDFCGAAHRLRKTVHSREWYADCGDLRVYSPSALRITDDTRGETINTPGALYPSKKVVRK